MKAIKGFSLIELLVALSILAVVAAIIVPRFLNVRSQAAATVTQTQQKTVEGIVQQWLVMGGRINGGTKSGSVLNFLSQTAASVTAGRASSGGCSDSTGVMGSATIILPVANTGDATKQGFVFAPGQDATYSDGSGKIFDITITPATGNTLFTPRDGSTSYGAP